jgi:sialate O-acetylesterase
MFLAFVLSVQASVSLPKIFSDNMVLQREMPIAIWGWAAPGEKVEVSFNKQKQSVVSDSGGKWMLKLKPEKAGGPFELSVRGENTIVLKNVLVGEVWLCSGQSNMEWIVMLSANSKEELAAADNPYIRHIKILRSISGLPRQDVEAGGWQESSSKNTAGFTAVGYFFAKRMYQELKVPVGLINSSWGGTNIETWISREGFESSNEFRDMIAKMPKIDLDSIAKRAAEAQVKKVTQLQGGKPGFIDGEVFKSESFDDTKLPEMSLPGQWESKSLGNMDGVVWFRKTIVLTAQQAALAASVELAKIDDRDQTFINGVEIGQTNSWDAPRKYMVPSGALKAGRNLIAVKVTDTGGGGGFHGDVASMKLTLGNESIPLSGDWKFQVESISAKTSENGFPSIVYNAMVHPLIPYSLRGVLWYQGESNAGRSYQYRTAFPLLIGDWRKKWGSEFPFYFVQLATYGTNDNPNTGSGWAELREAQTMTLKIPKTGMAVTTDIGDPQDVHPLNKQDVGRRLAAMALHDIFKRKIVSRSPSFKSMKVEGNKVILSFDNVGGGLMTTGGSGEVLGFYIAASDQVFHTATAKIQGKTVVLYSDKVSVPVAVRFGWAGDASANNLFNKEGFPADPFRTDDWKTVTKEAKYQMMPIEP